MNFIYSCIGDNVPENREHLEKIGYVRGFFNIPNRGYIKTINPGTYNLTNIIQPLTEYINCIGNPTLFRAVTAIREGSDYMQWFTCKVKDGLGNQLPDSWVLCTQKTLQDFGWVNNSPNSYGKNTPYHKATLAELQEHFK